ncbi:hypothetical protein D3C73_1430240 [compost metagenome]
MIIWQPLCHPLVTATGFQIPDFFIIHDGNAETFTCADGFNDMPQQGHRVTCGFAL